MFCIPAVLALDILQIISLSTYYFLNLEVYTSALSHITIAGCVQPMSPDIAAVGVYFPTPRTYRQVLNCTAFIQEKRFSAPHRSAIINCGLHYRIITFRTRCTRGVRVVFSRARMRSSNSARMNKSNFTTEKIV